MRTIIRLISITIIAALLTQPVSANEQTSVLSSWAAWDVQMCSVYELGNAETYTLYQEKISDEQLSLVFDSLNTTFDTTETVTETDQALTRGQVITELYEFIVSGLKLEDSEITLEKAQNYFVDNQLLSGRSNNDYALDSTITNEEMLVFTKRVYDHMIYATDMDITGAFWQVSDGDNTVYLLGSIHLTDGSVYPLNDKIMTALNTSEAIVVEANTLVTNPEDAAYVQQLMFLEPGTTIDTLISEETYALYEEKAAAIGYPKATYDQLKPWAASLILTGAKMAEGNVTAGLGIDIYFQMLTMGQKPIMEIEGTKFQIELFDSFDAELQEGMLLGILQDQGESQEFIGAILDSWKSGDI